MSAHGPDHASYEKALAAELKPHYLGETLAIMFESRYVFEPTAEALASVALDKSYDTAWTGFQKGSLPPGGGAGRGS
jgi:homogentisate 1,2-dioxygenase